MTLSYKVVYCEMGTRFCTVFSKLLMKCIKDLFVQIHIHNAYVIALHCCTVS